MTDVAPMSKTKLHQFKWFIKEREAIRLKKEQGFERSRWTKDPVLKHYHFTNINRKHDTGTVFIINKLEQEMALGMKRYDVLFNAITYRAINNIETARVLFPLSAKGFRAEPYYRKLNEVKEQFGAVFSKAHQTCPYTHYIEGDETSGRKPKGKSDMNLTYANLAKWQAKWCREFKNEKAVFEAPTLMEAVDVLRTARMGPLSALQTALDLTLLSGPVVRFSNLDQVPSNTGSQLGLESLFGVKSQLEYDALLLSTAKRTGLSPAECEHALCEYSKWVRIGEGVGRKRIYRPATTHANVLGRSVRIG